MYSTPAPSPVPHVEQPQAVLVLSGKALHPFKHGVAYEIGKFKLISSYHCSRYNTNTGVLTPKMFKAVFSSVRRHLDGAPVKDVGAPLVQA